MLGFFELLQGQLVCVEEATTNIQETSPLWKQDTEIDKEAWQYLSEQGESYRGNSLCAIVVTDATQWNISWK